MINPKIINQEENREFSPAICLSSAYKITDALIINHLTLNKRDKRFHMVLIGIYYKAMKKIDTIKSCSTMMSFLRTESTNRWGHQYMI